MTSTPLASPDWRVLHVSSGTGPAPEALAGAGAVILDAAPNLDLPQTRLFRVDPLPGFGPRRAAAVAAAIRDYEPQVVHTHDGALLHAIGPALWHRVPAIVHTVREPAASTVPLRWFRHWLFGGRVHAVAVSSATARAFAQSTGRQVTAVIPDGIVVERYAAPPGVRQFWRRKEGIPAASFVMLCADPFSEREHWTLLAALVRVWPRLPDSLLLLMGGGAGEAELKAEAVRLGVANRVKFLGGRRDIPDAMAAADAFICLTSALAGSTVLPQAMAAGLPSAAVGAGAADWIRSGEDGFVMPAGDPESLAQALLTFGEDPRRRVEMSRSARIRARETASVDASRAAYERLYARITGRSGAAPEARLRTSRVLEMSWRKGDRVR